MRHGISFSLLYDYKSQISGESGFQYIISFLIVNYTHALFHGIYYVV